MAKDNYKVAHTAAQEIKAPAGEQKQGKSGAKVIRGKDLRGGKGK